MEYILQKQWILELFICIGIHSYLNFYYMFAMLSNVTKYDILL